jgi:hypothetical protein
MVKSKKKIIFHLVFVFLIVNFFGVIYTRQAESSIIDVRILHLHILLNNVKSTFLGYQESTIVSKTKANNASPSLLINNIDHAINLLQDVIDAFNKSGLISQNKGQVFLRIKNGFINACNLLYSVKNIKPRYIRALRIHFERFNEFVKNCCSNKNFLLSDVEFSIYMKIIRFNNFFLSQILNKKYFQSTCVDILIDSFWYRPLNFISDNPFLIGSVLIVGGLLFCGNYNNDLIKNKNAHVAVHQFVVRGQYRQDCGYHAAFNLACFIRGNNNIEQINQLIADDVEFNRGQQACVALHGTDNSLVSNQIEALLLRVFGIQANRLLQDITVIDINNENELNWLVDINGFHLNEKRQRLNAIQSQSQYLIVNTGGHWRPFVFIKDITAQGGIRVLTGESLFNINITNHSIIRILHRFFSNA